MQLIILETHYSASTKNCGNQQNLKEIFHYEKDSHKSINLFNRFIYINERFIWIRELFLTEQTDTDEIWYLLGKYIDYCFFPM